MIEVTAEDVAAIAPEFADLASSDPDQFDMPIELAREFVCEAKWGTDAKAKKAICLMAAHLMKELGFGADSEGGSGGGTSAVGPVTMEKVGDLQRSYGAAITVGGSVSEQLLATTTYGKTFVMLRRTLALTPRVV